jgi:uncharacterized protein YkwD
MKETRALLALAVLAAILCAVMARGRGQSNPTDQNQDQRTASQGWHHFGDTGQPAPSASSGWRFFGTHNAASRETSTYVVPRADSASAKAAPPPQPSSSTDVAPRSASAGSKAASTPHPASISALEHEMYELINRDRLDPANAAETGGRSQALRWNPALAAARAHSRDMLEQHFFAHVDQEGRSPGTRVKAAGISWQAVGENIAIYDNVARAQAAFMNEPRFGHNHRSNILDPKYTDAGVGIVQAPDGKYYITEEFVETPHDLRAAFPP